MRDIDTNLLTESIIVAHNLRDQGEHFFLGICTLLESLDYSTRVKEKSFEPFISDISKALDLWSDAASFLRMARIVKRMLKSQKRFERNRLHKS